MSAPSGGTSAPSEGTSGREAPLARAGFRTLRPMPLRWDDIDRYGHANNVAYLAWFDTAVNDLYAEAGFLAQTDPHFLVAETGCRFFREVLFSDAVRIGVRVRRIGRSSVTYDLAVFVADEPTARAQGRYVHVLVSDGDGRPVPIEGALRAFLQAL